MTKKIKEKNLKNISDVAKEIGLIDEKKGKLLTHTLRFWETKFHQIRPTIISGNRRYYSQKDINIIKLIKFLLKDQGLTIEGAKKIMNKNVNSLDDYKSSSIKAEYFKNIIKQKSKIILNKINKIKK